MLPNVRLVAGPFAYTSSRVTNRPINAKADDSLRSEEREKKADETGDWLRLKCRFACSLTCKSPFIWLLMTADEVRIDAHLIFINLHACPQPYDDILLSRRKKNDRDRNEISEAITHRSMVGVDAGCDSRTEPLADPAACSLSRFAQNQPRMFRCRNTFASLARTHRIGFLTQLFSLPRNVWMRDILAQELMNERRQKEKYLWFEEF